jgi:oligoendopeptidase F
MSYDSTDKSLEALVEVVTTKGYALSKKYFAQKKRLLGTELTFIDRNQKLGELPQISYETAVTICRDAFYGFNTMYGEIFDEMLSQGKIDAFPKKGKTGGAFSISSTKVPTLVLLNHSSDFLSVSTLAHEMGHAIHAYRSKEQSVFYDGHSTVTAETASTFFEAVIGNALLETLEGKQRMLLLDALIGGKIDTMMMCIARYAAELEIHETIRTDGSMTWQDMAAVQAKHFRRYCGKAITVDDSDGFGVLHKTHYRRNFYQFTYSFGEIMSSIMYSRYQNDASYTDEIDTFLSAGAKDTIENIYKEIGINIAKPGVFEEGLSILENQIKEFTQLTRKHK